MYVCIALSKASQLIGASLVLHISVIHEAVVYCVTTLHIMPFSTAICSELNNPAFGTVSLTGRTVGSTATYMCNPGYNLVGTVTRTCEQLDVATADWSDAPPTCQRMYVCA